MKTDTKMIKEVLTKKDILKKLFELGVKRGMTVEVHSSLASFGYVIGGAQTVVDALVELVGEEGTILMPLHGSCSEPSLWKRPSIALELIPTIREHEPAFNKINSDTRKMGVIVDNFRRRKGVEVSSHPLLPFVALGKHAKFLCNRHSLHFSLSEESPLARLYELRGYVLLLGVGFDSCTMMHLGEYRSDCRPIILQGAAIEVDGQRQWKKYLDIVLNSDDFIAVEKIMQQCDEIQQTTIGQCNAKLFRADIASARSAQFLEKKTVYHLYR